MQEHNIDRVREDLAVIHEAMGGRAYGVMDVRFLAAESLSALFLTISIALGADSGWPFYLSALPVIVVSLAYLGYLAAKSRRDSDVSDVRRKEFRTSLVVIVPAIIFALVSREWAIRAGMTHLQFGGAILVVMGSIFVLMGVLNYSISRYPRTYPSCVGVPLVACGLVLPFCTITQALISTIVMGAAVAGSMAILFHRDLSQESNERSNATD